MTFDPNDPKLTAFALGELDNVESAEFEALVKVNEAARIAVEEIRKTAELLTSELRQESFVGLTADQRDSLARESSTPKQPAFLRRYWLPLSAAASALLAVGAYQLLPSLSRNRELSGDMLAMVETNCNGDEARPQFVGAYDTNLSSSAAANKAVAGRKPASPSQERRDRRSAAKGKTIKTPTTVARTEKLNSLGYVGGVSGGQAVVGVVSDPANAQMGMSQADSASASLPAFASSSGTSFTADNWYSFAEESDGNAAPAGKTKSIWQPQSTQSRVAKRSRRGSDQLPWSSDRFNFGRVRDEWPQDDSVNHSIYVPPRPESNSESYDSIQDNPFRLVDQSPLSTFSIDVDTASYANVRRFISQGMLPPAAAIRIEEMINYFDYDYPQPIGEHPFSVSVEVSECPWNGERRLARIGLKGMEIAREERPTANLVFLLDVSGSMSTVNKLPLLKKAMGLLLRELNDDDRVAIVVYAGASGLVLPSTYCVNESVIVDALDRLSAGGSTNGGAGIQLAYDLAEENFIEDGINRVILATDGDFNVGVTSRTELIEMIEEKAGTGVFLSVLGFGMGNLQDATLEQLADKGNGNYAYIDTLNEANKVLVEQMGGTLITIAKDVKIQVEFNPAEVSAYRLVGYANRILAAQDFNDDTKDAGEIGAGHTVTALYEIISAGADVEMPAVDPLKYQERFVETAPAESGEMMTVKLRYKEPDGDTSKLIEVPVFDEELLLNEASDDFVFAASVASFGMLLRHSDSAAYIGLDTVVEFAEPCIGDDPHGYRTEFVNLVQLVKTIRERQP